MQLVPLHRGGGYSYEDQLRFLSSPPQLIVECDVRPEDDLKNKKGLKQ
jgi:hypothetical protein